MLLSQYVLGSTVLASAIIYHAFATREQMFPAVVYLATSKIAIASLGNLTFAWVVCLYKLIIKIFLGQLRDAEVERVNERLSQAVMETALAMTIFREEFNMTFVAMFVVLTFLKVLHWLLQDRVEFLDTMPILPTRTWQRTASFFVFLLAIDCSFIQHCLYQTVHRSAGVHMLFLFEYVIQWINIMAVAAKFGIALHDRNMDTVWENKGLYVMYLELVTDLLNLLVYLIFFIVVFLNYGLPLHLVRDLYWTFRNFKNRVANFVRYRRVASYMEEHFPDATPQDLARCEGVCIICREDMTLQTKNKKLACGHIFHLRCLRSWLERQQNCPTCRAAVEAAPDQASPQAPNAARPGEPPNGRPAGAAGPQNVQRPAPAPAPQQADLPPGAAAPRQQPPPRDYSRFGLPQQPREAQTAPSVRPVRGHQQQAGPSISSQTVPPTVLSQAQPNASAASSAHQPAASQPGGFVLQPVFSIPDLQGLSSGVQAPQTSGTSSESQFQSHFAWTPAYSSPVMWNVPTWGAGPSMALYYPAVQYAGQEHPRVAQMSMAATIPILPLMVPPSLDLNLREPSIPSPPAGASPQEIMHHRHALQAARAAAAVASSVYNGWHENPLMLPPSLIDQSQGAGNSSNQQAGVASASQARQDYAAALGSMFASQGEFQRQLHVAAANARYQDLPGASQPQQQQQHAWLSNASPVQSTRSPPAVLQTTGIPSISTTNAAPPRPQRDGEADTEEGKRDPPSTAQPPAFSLETQVPAHRSEASVGSAQSSQSSIPGISVATSSGGEQRQSAGHHLEASSLLDTLTTIDGVAPDLGNGDSRVHADVRGAVVNSREDSNTRRGDVDQGFAEANRDQGTNGGPSGPPSVAVEYEGRASIDASTSQST